MREDWRARVAALLPSLTLIAIGLTIGASGAFAWSVTLLLGVALASMAIGWGIAEAVARVPRPPSPEVAPPEPG